MPRRRISFRQLETFAEVARHGSFTRAAEALHLTQPAVSIQIRQISDTIGMQLFEQRGREIAPTAAGEELLTTVRNLDDAWNRFESAIDALKGFRRGKVRVGLVTTAKHFLPRLLGAFWQRYPNIALELEIANRDTIVDRLLANRDDLYVMSYPPDRVDVVSLPFLDNEHVVLAPAAHWAVGRRVTLAELAGEHFLLREAGSGSRHVIDRYLRETGIALNVRLSLASSEAIRELVAAGMGLAVLSRHALGDIPAGGGLAVLDVAGFPLRNQWCVVHLRDKVLSLPAQALLDDLLQGTARPARPARRAGSKSP